MDRDTSPSNKGLRVRDPFPSDRYGFNRRWSAPHLEAVYSPRNADSVAAHVDDALRRYGTAVKVASGRHAYEAFVFNESTRALIDLSSVSEVGYDHERGTYFVDAGCDLGTMYRTMFTSWGRTLPAGSCLTVGAGGHIANGGYGLLSRLHGLTIDHLSAVDIVTWNHVSESATLRHVSAASSDRDERDLFWALRGAGGGNFGVIARYHFNDLPLAPAHATLATLRWRWSDVSDARFARLLNEYADVCASLPPEEFTTLHLTHASARYLRLTWQRVSSHGTSRAQHARHARHRLRQIVTQLSSAAAPERVWPRSRAQHGSYLWAVQTNGGSGISRNAKHKSAYVRSALPAEHSAAAFEWLHTVPDGLAASGMTDSVIQINSYGGAVNEVANNATAIAQRDSLLKLHFITHWPQESLNTDAHLWWIRSLYSQTYAAYGGTPDPSRDAHGTVDGCYFNYPDIDLGTHDDARIEHALSLYFHDNLRGGQRNLVSVKRRWDATNMFCHSQSIPVA